MRSWYYKIRWKGVVLLAIGIFICYIGYQNHSNHIVMMQRQHYFSMEPQTVMHSTRRFHEIRVPFRFAGANAQIEIHATINGIPAWCFFDTGSPAVLCPEPYCGSSQNTKLVWPDYTPVLDAASREGTLKIASDIRIGDYQIKGCPVTAFGVVKSDLSTIRTPIIGNSPFAHNILTIDFRHQQIILRDASYDALHDNPSGTHLHQRVIVKFDWSKSSSPLYPGTPLVSGAILGNPCTFALDTGASTMVITNRDLINRVRHHYSGPSSHQYPHQPDIETLANVSWSLAGIQLQTSFDIVSQGAQWKVSDANLGRSALRKFDYVTLDYPHQQVVFE